MLDDFMTALFGAQSVTAEPLSARETAQLQRILERDEQADMYLRGRATKVGWMIWVLTRQHLLVLNPRGRRPPVAYPLTAVVRLEALMGYWGASLRIEVEGATESVFAADAALGDAFLAALAERCPGVTAPAPLGATASAELADPAGDAEQELAALRSRGLVSEQAYATLLGKLKA